MVRTQRSAHRPACTSTLPDAALPSFGHLSALVAGPGWAWPSEASVMRQRRAAVGLACARSLEVALEFLKSFFVARSIAD